jgi:hypothetical protein
MILWFFRDAFLVPSLCLLWALRLKAKGERHGGTRVVCVEPAGHEDFRSHAALLVPFADFLTNSLDFPSLPHPPGFVFCCCASQKRRAGSAKPAGAAAKPPRSTSSTSKKKQASPVKSSKAEPAGELPADWYSRCLILDADTGVCLFDRVWTWEGLHKNEAVSSLLLSFSQLSKSLEGGGVKSVVLVPEMLGSDTPTTSSVSGPVQETPAQKVRNVTRIGVAGNKPSPAIRRLGVRSPALVARLRFVCVKLAPPRRCPY